MRSSLLALCSLLFALSFTGCTSVPTAPTDKQTVIANAVEDALSLGLVPVLVKNPDYVPVARSIAAALATFTGDTLEAVQVESFLGKTSMAPEDAATVAALINGAWDTYSRRYAQQVNAQVRPDVKIFLAAVSNGITRALAALPARPAAAQE